MTARATETEPAVGASRRHRLTGPALIAAAVVLSTVVLVFVDPNKGHLPICPLKASTGLDCPGCGGLRCVHDLATGHPAAAANQNVLAVTLLPLAIVYWLVWAVRRWRGDLRPVAIPPRVFVGLGILAFVFALVRNLPFVPYLRSGLG